jgi:hypothetical protein
MLMKKWMNTIFFGSCFIVAIILEAYGMVAWDGNLFSVIALGIVVLITGYLFMDAIRSKLKQGSEDVRFYFDKVLNEESEKRTERHTEIVNLQKASYTATKKNAVLLTEQFTEVLTRLEALEENNSRTLQKIIELQRTSLEGQKNALNLEVSYSKDNTRKIIEALKEDSQDHNLSGQLSDILSAIEENNRLLKDQMLHAEETENHYGSFEDNTQTFEAEILSANIPEYNGFTEDIGFGEENQADAGVPGQEAYTQDFYEEMNTTDHIDDFLPEETDEEVEENAPESSWSIQDELEPEADNQVGTVEEEEKKITPLYEDPNKALTADEIAALFASFGN